MPRGGGKGCFCNVRRGGVAHGTPQVWSTINRCDNGKDSDLDKFVFPAPILTATSDGICPSRARLRFAQTIGGSNARPKPQLCFCRGIVVLGTRAGLIFNATGPIRRHNNDTNSVWFPNCVSRLRLCLISYDYPAFAIFSRADAMPIATSTQLVQMRAPQISPRRESRRNAATTKGHLAATARATSFPPVW